MSDFLYISKKINNHNIEEAFKSVAQDVGAIEIFNSKDKILALSDNVYHGFKPFSNSNHVCAVLGGPVLNFADNSFITDKHSNQGTKLIYDRWINSGDMVWDYDLSGPFVVVLFDLVLGTLTVVTDMMSFIPIFSKNTSNCTVVSSHLSIIDSIVPSDIDNSSVADFIMNNVVTFPYTIFKEVNQLFPASIHIWKMGKSSVHYSFKEYWFPIEPELQNQDDIKSLSSRLKLGLTKYINCILKNHPTVGILLSGGEDSRSIAAMLPSEPSVDGFMFSANINNEVRITQRVAKINKIKLNVAPIYKSHFLRYFDARNDLVGPGSDSANVHSFGYHVDLKFGNYDAIFGGFLADTFLKGLWSSRVNRKHFCLINNNIHKTTASSDLRFSSHPSINKKYIDIVNQRRLSHWSTIKKFRPKSVEEWMGFWPISMQRDIPNIHGNRRLFRSYEPFTASEVIKVSSLASQSQKFRRKLFQQTMKSIFKDTKFLPHNNGFLPYFSYWPNKLLFVPVFKIIRVLRKITNEQGSTFTDWNDVFTSPEGEMLKYKYLPAIEKYCVDIFTTSEPKALKAFGSYSNIQKRNILQLGYFLYKKHRTADN
jgi:hypothetical protein